MFINIHYDMKRYYMNTNILVIEDDIVKTIYNDKDYKISVINTDGTVCIYDDYDSGFGSYPISKLTFIRREIEDPEEILP
jgi:hypothetical protein